MIRTRYARAALVLAPLMVGLGAVATSAHMAVEHPRSNNTHHAKAAKSKILLSTAIVPEPTELVGADLHGSQIEIEKVDSTKTVTGANLYPHYATSTDVGVYNSALFPVDQLYNLLGMGSAAMHDTPIFNPDTLDKDGKTIPLLDWVNDTNNNTDA